MFISVIKMYGIYIVVSIKKKGDISNFMLSGI